jgi:thioredoxin reductase/2-polyprenyl-3-methyl-5-hydroxy-6-metoxy-1,4-benzoquinol methylase
MTENQNIFDTVIVGGGAAGLSAAVTLGRARRSVAVIDAGQPRNAPADGVHGFLTRDGLSPLELTRIGREEAESYGATVIVGTVTATRGSLGHFVVTLTDGSEVTGRRLLITTGLVDELPDIPGVREHWGHNVVHCPYCHGWEIRDGAIGILGTGPRAVHQALLFRQWSERITLFLHTAPEPTEQEWEQLAARGITVIEGAVESLKTVDDALRGVVLAGGREFALDAVVVAPQFSARTELFVGVGATISEHPSGAGLQVDTDPMGATSVPGVWAAGNVSDLMAQVVVAAAEGLRAASAINADLLMEDVRTAVDARRATSTDQTSATPVDADEHGTHEHAADEHAVGEHAAHEHGPELVTGPFDAAFWDNHYGSAAIWSGNPNPRLVTETSALPPGTALDVGSGEGADAIWLAARGWRVTGVDISQVALDRAKTTAQQVDVAAAARIAWEQHDLTDWAPAPASYDLVSAQFMHLPLGQREVLFRDLAAAVAPGGTLLIVGHDASDMGTGHRWDIPGMFYGAEEIADSLDENDWDVVVSESLPRQVPAHRAPGASPSASDESVTMHDVVVRAVRRA